MLLLDGAPRSLPSTAEPLPESESQAAQVSRRVPPRRRLVPLAPLDADLVDKLCRVDLR